MYTPLLAAVAVASMIALAPITTPKLLSALDVGDVFEPLTCAMAHSGPCFQTHEYGGPPKERSHPNPHRPVLAAAIE